ncbi:uncharacterized protein [Venturia canescens]|uniref:uncharacterized protein n=1 Tax=Venturia canescens TaxID=32260 RepID=UPI001C9C34AF|nr:uncharacterized protein LOC122407563 [Venturia canescens]
MGKLLIAFLLIFSISSAIKISSKIDLESEEECSDLPSTNLDPVTIVIKNEPEIPKESSQFRPSTWRSNSGGSFFSGNPGNSIKTRNPHNPFMGEPRMVKNIHITVNGKDVSSSIPASVNCEKNTCETTITMNKNEEDNEIVSVSVKVVTKSKTLGVEDVPVIDGIRASGYDNVSPTLFPKHGRAHPTFIDNNIPQGQLPRRNRPRQPSASFYPRNFGSRVPTAWNPWIPGRSPVDDKIEPPLSKTDHVVQ